MADAKSHAVQVALSVARTMRRPARLLSATMARAERILPDDGLHELASADFASTLAALLARVDNTPSARGRARTKVQGPAAAMRPLRAVSGIQGPSPVTADATARTGATRQAARRRELAFASRDFTAAERAEAPALVPRHPRTSGQAEPAESRPRDPAAQRATIAAARDRLRATGQAPIRSTSSSAGVSPLSPVDAEDHPAAQSEWTSASTAFADREFALADLLSLDMPSGVSADETSFDPTSPARAVGVEPLPAAPRNGMPASVKPLPITQRTSAAATPLPASQYVPEPPVQRTRAGLVLDDEATELLEEAYRHGVDVTWR